MSEQTADQRQAGAAARQLAGEAECRRSWMRRPVMAAALQMLRQARLISTTWPVSPGPGNTYVPSGRCLLVCSLANLESSCRTGALAARHDRFFCLVVAPGLVHVPAEIDVGPPALSTSPRRAPSAATADCVCGLLVGMRGQRRGEPHQFIGGHVALAFGFLIALDAWHGLSGRIAQRTARANILETTAMVRLARCRCPALVILRCRASMSAKSRPAP